VRPLQIASDNHLAGIDAQAWPGIVDIPAGIFAAKKARRAGGGVLVLPTNTILRDALSI